MARTDPTIYMRIPADLKEALDKAAEANKRSLTAEVVARLQGSLDGVDTWANAFPHAAEAAFGIRRTNIAEETINTLQRMETAAVTDRIRGLEAQMVQLEAQSHQVDLERQMLERLKDQSALQGDFEESNKARESLERVIQILVNLDKQVLAAQRALKGERANLRQLQAAHASARAELPKE